MGYDLSNASGAYVRFTGSGWDLALAIARHYGWHPAGTRKPASWNESDGPWKDKYWLNAGQQVSADDASALATALERAIVSPDFADSVQRAKNALDEEIVEQNPGWRDDLRPLVPEDAEKFRARLSEFARFARQGPFIIE